jgi:hypothetical protein
LHREEHGKNKHTKTQRRKGRTLRKKRKRHNVTDNEIRIRPPLGGRGFSGQADFFLRIETIIKIFRGFFREIRVIRGEGKQALNFKNYQQSNKKSFFV